MSAKTEWPSFFYMEPNKLGDTGEYWEGERLQKRFHPIQDDDQIELHLDLKELESKQIFKKLQEEK